MPNRITNGGKQFKQIQASNSEHLTLGTANYSRRCTEVPKGHAAYGREELVRRGRGDVKGVLKLNSLDVATRGLDASVFRRKFRCIKRFIGSCRGRTILVTTTTHSYVWSITDANTTRSNDLDRHDGGTLHKFALARIDRASRFRAAINK